MSFLFLLFLFAVLPLLLVSVFTGIEGLPKRIIALAAVAVSLLWAEVAAIIVSVAIIIGVAFGNSLHGVTGSSV